MHKTAVTTVKERNCPLCRSRNIKSMYEISCGQAAQHFILKEVDRTRHRKLKAHIEKLWGKQKSYFYHCLQCSFSFAHPFVGGDQKFYSLAFTRSHYPSSRWEYEITKEKLNFLLKNKKKQTYRLLEIGAGSGSFIKKIAPDLISKENVLCTEFSEYGARKLREYGIKCFTSDIRTIARRELNGAFDIVCMFQVLEHTDNFNDFFERLSKITKPNSHFFISVPNSYRIKFNINNRSLIEMPPNHISIWEKSSFEVLCKRYSLNLIDFKCEKKMMFSFFAQFFNYYYLRKSQETNSAANYTERLRSSSKRLYYFLRILVTLLYVPLLSKSVKEMFAAEGGNSTWVHLQKRI